MYEDYFEQADTDGNINQCQIFKGIPFKAIEKDLYAVLISPTCDIAQNKLDYYNFCAILPFDIFFLEWLKDEEGIQGANFFSQEISRGKKKKAIRFIKMVMNGQFERYHWIGKLPGIEGYWYVDFQLMQTYAVANLKELKNQRIAMIKSPLKDSLYVRFSNYLGRVGLEGEVDQMTAEAKEIFDEIKANG